MHHYVYYIVQSIVPVPYCFLIYLISEINYVYKVSNISFEFCRSQTDGTYKLGLDLIS